MPNDERYSEASRAEIILGPEAKARREARNGVRQFERVTALIEKWTAPEAERFRLRPSTILELHRVALEGLDLYAGNYRPADVKIIGSRHEPPVAEEVPQNIEEFCDYVNEHWSASALHLAAYALWRINWIHPFTDGNGRTARAVSYLLLCIRVGEQISGRKTVPDFITENKKPYYLALEAADQGDLKPMEEYLDGLLYEQLYTTAAAASEENPNGEEGHGPKP